MIENSGIRVVKKSLVETLKSSMEVPFKELKISAKLSFIIFQIGSEPYYIKVLG